MYEEAHTKTGIKCYVRQVQIKTEVTWLSTTGHQRRPTLNVKENEQSLQPSLTFYYITTVLNHNK